MLIYIMEQMEVCVNRIDCDVAKDTKIRRFPPSYKGCNSPVADVKPNLLKVSYLSKKMLSRQSNIFVLYIK